MGQLINRPAQRNLLHPGADKRNALSAEIEPEVSMAKGADHGAQTRGLVCGFALHLKQIVLRIKNTVRLKTMFQRKACYAPRLSVVKMLGRLPPENNPVRAKRIDVELIDRLSRAAEAFHG